MVAALFGHRDVATDGGSDIPAALIDLVPEAQRQALLAQLGALRPRSLVERFKKSGHPYYKCAQPGTDEHASLWILTIRVAGETRGRAIPAHALEATRTPIAEYRRPDGRAGRRQRGYLPRPHRSLRIPSRVNVLSDRIREVLRPSTQISAAGAAAVPNWQLRWTHPAGVADISRNCRS